MTKIDDALIERCVALVRKMAGRGLNTDAWDYLEARNLTAELPAPVDPDVLIAREVAAAYAEQNEWDPEYIREVRSGSDDDDSYVQIALAALRRARDGGAS